MSLNHRRRINAEKSSFSFLILQVTLLLSSFTAERIVKSYDTNPYDSNITDQQVNKIFSQAKRAHKGGAKKTGLVGASGWELMRATLPLDMSPVYRRLTSPAEAPGTHSQLQVSEPGQQMPGRSFTQYPTRKSWTDLRLYYYQGSQWQNSKIPEN